MTLALTITLLSVLTADLADGGVVEAESLTDAGQVELSQAPDDDGDTPPPVDDVEAGDETVAAEVGPTALEATDGGYLYTADLTDADLAKRFAEDPTSLGSISVGNCEAGRLINGAELGEDNEAFEVVDRAGTYATQEVVDFVTAVAKAVHEARPDLPPLRVNHISKKDGGYHPPHSTHQSGRDVDLGFFWQPGVTQRTIKNKKEGVMDVAASWLLFKSIVTTGDVQIVLADSRVQAKLYAYALKQGEDKAWLDSLFHAGLKSLVHHARRHRDHFHVRYYSARAQELGLRIQPLLNQSPEDNVAIHRVKKGDTLGGIAHKYGSTVKAIQHANGLKNHMLKVGRTLNVPLRGPCSICPVPKPVVVPPRRLPPVAQQASLSM